MGRKRKEINQHYFDKKAENQWYLEGVFTRCFSPLRENGITFRSHHKGLVELVNNELDSKYTIIPDPRPDKDSYSLQLKNVPYLRAALDKRRLSIPKSERLFPTGVPAKYLRDVVRGILDAASEIKPLGKRLNLNIEQFNIDFLIALNETFAEYAKTEKANPTTSIVYGHNDTVKIGNWIYYANCLCLESKKQQFQTDYVADGRQPVQDKAFERVELAKILLKQGLPIQQTSEELGYAHRNSLNYIFKKLAGTTPTQYRKSLKSK